MEHKFEALQFEGKSGPINTYLITPRDHSKFAIVLPGAGYSCRQPLLHFAIQMLLEKGYQVLALDKIYANDPAWSALTSEEEARKVVEQDTEVAFRQITARFTAEPDLLMGRSLGTYSIAYALERDLLRPKKIVWQTPALRSKWNVMRDCGIPGFAIIGTADPRYFEYSAFRLSEQIVVDGADHGMEVSGDAIRSVEVLKQVTRATARWLEGNPSTPVTSEEFGKKFDRLIERLWEIQDRISELKEFEKQWKTVFDLLKSRTGQDCKIKILNDSVLRSFHWDKYQVLVSDLLSLQQNELEERHQDAVLRQTIHHLEVRDPDFYLDPNYSVNFIQNPGHEISEEAQREFTERLRQEEANRTHNYIKDALKRLFPNIKEDFKIAASDVQDLLNRLTEIAKRIRGLRHYFNHKYEESATARYKKALKYLDLNHIEQVTKEFFEIASDLGLAFKRASYAESSFGYESEISDQIDLILFGSIKMASNRFYKVANPDDHYWQARKKFFESEKILQIISP